ncbi:MAG: tyrosine-type recombinase/integrase [bacterium]
MAGRIKHFLERGGRYYSRIVVPTTLRKHLGGKTELRTPLGGDRRAAERAHPAALADLLFILRQSEVHALSIGQPAPQRVRQMLTTQQIVAMNYYQRLAQDDQMRQTTAFSAIPVDTDFAASLRAGMSGKLTDQALAELVGHRIERYIELGYTDALPGTLSWRSLAIALCASEYDALVRVYERDEGIFDGQPRHPLVIEAVASTASVTTPPPQPVSLLGLFDDYIAAKKVIGSGDEAARRWSPVFKNLRTFLGHDDAAAVSKKDLMAWRDELLRSLSPKTVADVYLSAVRTVLTWAVREDRLEKNAAKDVRQALPKKSQTREKGFTLAEACYLLRASQAYGSTSDDQGAKEYPETIAAKRWVPLLCAHTGARVAEMTQLRSQDVRLDGTTWVLRITAEAGTVKAGGYRDVPLHPQLVELGFPAFAKERGAGPLFYRSTNLEGSLAGARTVSGRISEWLNRSNLVPPGVAPSHGWRHRFKTVGREIGASDRVLDAICGHSGRTAGDNYGDVTISAKQQVIGKMPCYEL